MASSRIQQMDDQGRSLQPSTEPTPSKKTAKPVVETNRVKDSHMEDTIEDFHHTPKGKRATRSATVGKADPVRDLCIFVAVMAFFIYIAVKYDSFEKGQPDEDVIPIQERSLGKFKKIKKALSLVMEKHMERNPERQDCDLFLSKSTIPVSGFGIFAGRNYTTGEEIMILGYPSLHVSTEQSTPLWISPHALLFKHHPTMSNIKLSKPIWSNERHTSPSDDTSPIVLHAAKSIMLGEELFLTFEQHLHPRLPEWFDQVIPTMEDYKEADYLIHEARNTFRGPLSSRARNTNKRDQASVVGLALRMIQGIAERYRPAAAKLMRVALESLSTYSGKADQVTSLYMALKNQTLEKLRRQGLCISDVTTTTGTGTWNTVVTRNVTKGNRVYPVPLLVKLKPEARPQQQSCSNDNIVDGSEGLCQNLPIVMSNSCWSRPGVLVEVCPLHPLTNMHIVEPGTNDATVELQWTNWTDATKGVDVDLSTWREKEKSPFELMLVWDLVAIRDLQKGDEVTLSLERDAATGQWVVPMELLSKTKLGA